MLIETPENKKYQALVDRCLELYKDFGKSEYRAKKITEIKDGIERYEQKAPKVTFPWDNATCFHEVVEMLTESGWKLVKDVEIGEPVFSREPITGKITLEPVTETYTFDAPEKGLIRLSNLFFDIQVTDNHKFHLERLNYAKRADKVRETTALEIMEGYPCQTLYKLPLTGVWDTEPAMDLWGCNPNDFLSLLGWYISEGSCYKGRTISISQSQSANPEKVLQITQLLERMGFEYSYNNGTHFLVNMDRDIVSEFKSLGTKYEKRIPRMYLDLPPSQLQYLFNALIAGDGSIAWAKDKHRNYPSINYYTTSKGLADDIQELTMKLGYSSNIIMREPVLGGKIEGRRITGRMPLYTISVRFTKYSRFRHDRAKIERVEYSGKVYCVTVPPHHTIYVRQNGKCLWSGNSVYLPLVTITIDNLEPRLVAGLVGRDPVISFGDNLNDVDELIQDWYNDELKDTVKIDDVARSCVHTILKEGTWFSYPEYDYNEREMTDFEYDEEGQIVMDGDAPVKRTSLEIIFEGGTVNTIPFSDIYCADDLGTIKEWEEADKIIKVRPTYAELMQNKDSYINIGTWLLSAKSQRKLQDKTPDQIVAGVDVTGKEVIECIECHLSYPIANLKESPEDEEKQTDFTEQRIIATIALKTKTIIKFVIQSDVNMNNESLIKRVRLFPEEGRTFGTNIYGKIKSIQDGASNMFSQLMNIVTICMIPWYFYEDGSGVQGKQEIYPGAGVKVKDTSKILFPKYNINPQQYTGLLDMWFSLWEKLISISDPQIGKPTEDKKTATEILTVVEEGNIKHNYQSKGFKEEFLQILRTLYDLYYQYMPYDKTIEIDKEGKKEDAPFPRALMRRPNNFRLTSSTEKCNKLIERKENEDVFNMLRGDPLIDPIKLIKDLLKSYGRDDAEEYINPQMGQLAALIEQDPNALQVIMGAVQQYMSQEGGDAG